MRHTVKLRGVVVGHSDLEEADPSLGRAWGAFRPGFGYELVQPIFRLYSAAVPVKGGPPADEEKLGRYHAARDRLGLILVNSAGEQIATSAIHIADYSIEGSKAGMELDVLISDDGYWSEARGA